MADENQAAPQQAETSAEGKTQTESAATQAPMPEGDKQPAQTEAPARESAEGIKEDDLPEDASERTRQQFDKLKESNAELKKKADEWDRFQAEVRKRQLGEDALSSLRPQQQPGFQGLQHQAQGQPNLQQALGQAQEAGIRAQDLVDDEGMLDVGKLNYAITQQVQRAAQQAEQRAFQKVDEQRQVEETHSKFPSVDPASKTFNQEHYNRTQALLFHSMVRPDLYGGQPLRFVDAAQMAVGGGGDSSKEAFQEGAKAAMESLTPKEQASLQAQTRSDAGRSGAQQNFDELRLRTRKGDEKALAERIKAATSGK